MTGFEPLLLETRFVEVIWGGRRLAEELGKALPPDRRIGESWEVFGANRVINGPLAGLTLDEAGQRVGPDLLGHRVLARQNANDGFPLLIKFIDATLPLSVQVHPDDRFAREHEANSRGKTEAWYILAASNESELVYGLRDGVTAQRVSASVAAGTLADDLTYLRVRAGDAVFVPAGTVHAIGTGILLYEVQQRSEITYRLYDWNRVGADGRPRDLHVDKALAVMRFPQPPPRATTPLTIRTETRVITFLAACRYFCLTDLVGVVDDACDGSTFAALSTIAGSARLRWSGGVVDVPPGASVVLPANLGEYRLEVAPGGRVLRATVPDLRADVVEPLTAAGYDIADIERLGDLSTD